LPGDAMPGAFDPAPARARRPPTVPPMQTLTFKENFSKDEIGSLIMNYLAWVSALFVAALVAPAADAAPKSGTVPDYPRDSTEILYIFQTNPAQQCYRSAQNGTALKSGLEYCNLALRDPMMTNRAQNMVNRGIVRYDLGDADGALKDFHNALNFNPALGDAYLNQALVLVAQKRPQLAMEAISKGIALGATNLQLAYYIRGEIQDDAGHYAQAYSDYSEALKIKPGFEPAIRQLTRFRVVPKPAATE
jgi:tetratricopeptide (TPR) repeat protein